MMMDKHSQREQQQRVQRHRNVKSGVMEKRDGELLDGEGVNTTEKKNWSEEEV